MKQLGAKEQKKLLIEMLKYFNRICEKNNIKYTLIGGSLIGAIRHKGIIPWDDDIDVILMPEEYKKLLEAFKNEKHDRYKLFYDQEGYYYPYPKLIDTGTSLTESTLRTIDNYGLFIDIFPYHYVSNNKLFRNIHFKMVKMKKTFINGYFFQHIEKDSKHYYLRVIRRFISEKLGIKKILKMYNRECNINHKKTDYVMSNWPAYSQKGEIQESRFLKDYMMVKFDNIDVMITKDYDSILKNTFGDYMKLPPEDKRVAHNLTVYEKDKIREND